MHHTKTDSLDVSLDVCLRLRDTQRHRQCLHIFDHRRRSAGVEICGDRVLNDVRKVLGHSSTEPCPLWVAAAETRKDAKHRMRLAQDAKLMEPDPFLGMAHTHDECERTKVVLTQQAEDLRSKWRNARSRSDEHDVMIGWSDREDSQWPLHPERCADRDDVRQVAAEATTFLQLHDEEQLVFVWGRGDGVRTRLNVCGALHQRRIEHHELSCAEGECVWFLTGEFDGPISNRCLARDGGEERWEWHVKVC